MKRLFYLFSLLWCGLFCAVSHAATVDGLYEAEIAAINQSDRERDRLLPAAFQQVLVKVIGQHQLPAETVEQLLPSASQFVQQFRFRNNPEWAEYQAELLTVVEVPEWQSVDEVDSESLIAQQGEVVEPSLPPEPYLLAVQFDAQMVSRSLRELAVPVWGRERPAMLLWLVVDDFGARATIGGDTLLELQVQIKKQSKQRGIPLWLPLYDLQDTTTLQLGDLWGGFAEPILAASDRYQTDAVIVGRVQRALDDSWLFRWSMYDQTGVITVEAEVESLEVGLASGLDGLIDQQAERYTQSIDANELSNVVLQLLEVNDLAAFAGVSEYLRTLESVKGVQLRQLSGHGVLVELQVLGGAPKLQQLLGLGKRLVPVLDEVSSSPNALLYRLQP